MPKRNRKLDNGPGGNEDGTDFDEEEDAKIPAKQRRTDERSGDVLHSEEKGIDRDDDEDEDDEDEGDEDEDDEDEDEEADSDGDESEEEPSQNYVAWLKEDSSSFSGMGLGVGELHFSNVEHIGSQEAPNAYCVVYELKLMPASEDEEDEESPMIFRFDGGFPFKVLPASACVGIPMEPVLPVVASTPESSAADKEEEEDELIFTEYSLEADVYRGLLEDLIGNASDKTYADDSLPWKLPKIATEQAVVDGLNALWKAGEDKTGWDLSKIPKDDYTSAKTLRGNGGGIDSTNHNILLDLYKDLCAFRPLTPKDDRDTIEERFEWRTCLCTYFAWAVPNQEALEVLSTLGQPILEIGAGTGYWAWLLAGRGVDVVAYDAVDSHDGHKHRFRLDSVRDGGVEQASSEEHKGRALMLCWPDIVGDSASDDADRGTFGVDTLSAYTGDTVVYVGELGPGVVQAAKGWGDPFPPGGSSASAAFQDKLLAGFELSKRVNLPNWPPYNSHLTVWKRKPK